MKLLVHAEGSALVPDFAALESGILRFVGRRHDASVGVNGAWVPTGEPVELPLRVEYVQEVQAGALVPCNAETAAACRVRFTAPKTAKTDTK